MNPRIIFMGSPDFAIPSLEALADKFQVVGVVTQPDRPGGRGRSLVAPPVKIIAEERGIPLIQPTNLSQDNQAFRQLSNWNPDLIVVAAFGQILKQNVLNLPRYGCLNVHASLLPRWRGVSPIQAAILNGDEVTGVTIMKMDEGIDTGDILAQTSIPIEPQDTGGSLFEKLAPLGANLLIKSIPAYLNGEITPTPQGPSPTPYAPMLKKTDGKIDFSQPAHILSRQVKAYYPWPGAYTHWQDKNLKIHKAHVANSPSPGCGKLTRFQGKPAIGTGDDLLVLDIVQPAGKKPMSGEAFLLGAREWGHKDHK